MNTIIRSTTTRTSVIETEYPVSDYLQYIFNKAKEAGDYPCFYCIHSRVHLRIETRSGDIVKFFYQPRAFKG